MGPNDTYLPILERGAQISSKSGLNFLLTENVDFSDPKNSIVVARVDASTGAPTHYAVKAYGNVVSGMFGFEQLAVGSFERFRKVTLKNPNITEIISVYDAEGNEYFEVEYLSQDMIFKEIANNNYKEDNVPSIIKPLLVSRKFVVERTSNNIILQFGSGDLGSTDVVASPQQVALNVFGKSYVSDTSFDPTKLYKNKSMGICPSNTTLYISYRSVNPFNSNVAVGGINGVGNFNFQFKNRELLNEGTINLFACSLEASNETPIVGDTSNPSPGELKRRIMDTFPTQNRAVTQVDYENVAYRMPVKFGSVKRVSVQKDQDSLKRNLNMFVISEDKFGKLVETNTVIKQNLKTWLNQYRMINDTIDILDPYIVNFGIDFVIRASIGANKSTLLGKAVTVLRARFAEQLFIGEPIYISDIYTELNKITGILDVMKVKLINKSGGNYSPISFNVNQNLSPDGTYLMAPANAVFELKYPEVDIKGQVR